MEGERLLQVHPNPSGSPRGLPAISEGIAGVSNPLFVTDWNRSVDVDEAVLRAMTRRSFAATVVKYAV